MTPQEMWKKFKLKNTILKGSTYESWYFGDTPQMARELSNLVLKNIKTGACSLLLDYEENEAKPKVGDYSIITDFEGNALCIIEIISVEIIPYNKVTEEYAKLEGEGDLSLDYWQNEHYRYFKPWFDDNNLEFDFSTPLIFETFKVVAK